MLHAFRMYAYITKIELYGMIFGSIKISQIKRSIILNYIKFLYKNKTYFCIIIHLYCIYANKIHKLFKHTLSIVSKTKI